MHNRTESEADQRKTSAIKELQSAEEQMLAQKRDDPESDYFVGDAQTRMARRRFMLGSAAAVSTASGFSLKAWAATPASPVPLGSVRREVPSDASKVQGYPLEDESYGSRSQFETEVRTRYTTATPQSSWTFTPLEKGCGIITPSGLHFERSHGGTATINPSTHSLYVHGWVKQAKKFSMKDIRRFPSISRIMFLECSGNGLTEWSKPTLKTVLQSRCTDDTGYLQPTLGQLIAVRGLNGPLGSIYHLNAIQSWQVATDGKVSNVHNY